MKSRQFIILNYITANEGVQLQKLLNKFSISKRTLYYDISNINKSIINEGIIKNVEGSFFYFGINENHSCIQNDFVDNVTLRKNYVLYHMILGDLPTISELCTIMDLSKNTITMLIEKCKIDFLLLNLKVTYKKKYIIEGDEHKIRDLFLTVIENLNPHIDDIDEDIIKLDEQMNLRLTDFSRKFLSELKKLIVKRIKIGLTINELSYQKEVCAFKHYHACKMILPSSASENEVAYLCAYISSLPTLNTEGTIDRIDDFIDELVLKFEQKTAIKMQYKKEFKVNIKRHIQSSYYRIKFCFPAHNPILYDVKMKYEYLFLILQKIIKNSTILPEFKKIRDEEIGFITTYFGGYLMGEVRATQNSRAIIVCPNGYMMSKTLELQIYRFVPGINIIGTTSLSKLDDVIQEYDYIISTLPLLAKKEVIVVNPILTKGDIDLLLSIFTDIGIPNPKIDIEKLIKTVEKYSTVHDYKKLETELLKTIHQINENERYQPMLNELLTENRINSIDSVCDWKQAIAVAAKPLIDDGSITNVYVESMIENVIQHGPYIVLADYFALPHAGAKDGVNQLSMSLLQVKNEVDLAGVPVHTFLVLAAIDNSTHITALAALSELLYEEKNLKLFQQGSVSEIRALIEKGN